MFGIDINTTVPDLIKDVGVPVTVAIFAVLGSIFVAALSFALTRWSDAAARRRDGYAAAQKVLVAYREYAWRVRRRTSDAPEELRRLVDIGHQLQEDLAYHQAWTRSESGWVGKVFGEVRVAMATEVGPAVNLAWATPPITSAADMVLGSWGPAGLDAKLARFERATEFRFGWRRAVAVLGWHPGA